MSCGSENTAGRQDLRMRTNETFLLHLTYCDPNDLPVDITGCEVKMQVRDKPRGQVILDSSTTGGMTAIDGPNGLIDVAFDTATMNAVTADNGVYDVALTWPNANVDVIVEGTVRFVEGVTV